MFYTVVVLREKKLSYGFCFWKLSNDSERRAQVYLFLSSVNYRRVYSTHWKKARFVEEVLFYPKNEVVAFPEIEIKWK